MRPDSREINIANESKTSFYGEISGESNPETAYN